MEIEHARKDFSFLKNHIYLDTGAVGLSFDGQEKAAARFYTDTKCKGFTAAASWEEKVQQVKERLAAIMKVKPSEIYFMSSTTESVNLIAHSIQLAENDEIVVAADDYPAVEAPWSILEKQGIHVKRIVISNEAERAQQLLSKMTERTKLLAVSQVQYTTGTCVDLDSLGEECKKRNVMLLVDGTQAFTTVKTDLTNVDFYTVSTYKWLLGSFGLSVLVIKDSVMNRLIPAYVGYEGRRIQYGTMNYPTIWVLDAALDYLDGLGWENIAAKDHQLAAYYAGQLIRMGIIPETPSNRTAAIVSFYSDNAQLIPERLMKENIFIAQRNNHVRVSAHFYNNYADIDCLISKLKEYQEEGIL